jgi:hypothetical protein
MKKWILCLMGVSIPFIAQAYVQSSDTITVKSSEYQSDCSSRYNDCTKTVQKYCDGHSGCLFPVDDSLCGDPEPNCSKHLKTIYYCPNIPSGTVVTTREGGWQHLTCG